MYLKKLTGILLHNQPIGEYDRVLTVFSRECGKTRIIAKGVRKITSHRGPHLDVLSILRLEVEQSNTEKQYLREVTTIRPCINIRKEPKCFLVGCTIASFLLRLLPEGFREETLYDLTTETLELLKTTAKNPQEILLIYLLKATRLLGYLPSTLPKALLRKKLQQALSEADPQFTFTARRTLGIFSKLDNIFSS